MTYFPVSIGFRFLDRLSRFVTVNALRTVFNTVVVNSENIQIETVDKNVQRKTRVDTDCRSSRLTGLTPE